MKNKVMIIGAGIAGSVLAIELKKLGYKVELYEARNKEKTNEGAFLGITPNGLNILSKYISMDELKQECTPGSMRFYNRKMVEIATLPTSYQKEKYGFETLQVKRNHLNQLLCKAADAEGIQIRFGKQCKDIKETDEEVQVFFEDGQIVTCDFLLGCDGTFSTVRKTIFPSANKQKFTQNISTAGFTKIEQTNDFSKDIHMIFGSKGFFAFSVSNKGEVWWFNNYYKPEESSKNELQHALQTEIKQNLLEIHQKDHPIIAQILEETHQIIAYPVYDIPLLTKWHTKRVCLLGDAAHATSPHIGQGASLALEDVVCLAKSLAKASSVHSAFAQFQSLRKERVEKIIKQARKVGNTKSKSNPVATWFRDQLLGMFIKNEIKKTDWIYGYKS